MSSDTPTAGGRVCGCLGCHAPATAVIIHPTSGRRTVCDDHAGDREVIERV